MMPRSTSVVPPWNGEFWCGLDRKRQLLLQRLAIGGGLLDKGGEVAHAMRQLLLPDRADVLDDRGFHHRLLAGLQHAGNRDRHAAHGVHLRTSRPMPSAERVSGFLPTARTSSVST